MSNGLTRGELIDAVLGPLHHKLVTGDIGCYDAGMHDDAVVHALHDIARELRSISESLRGGTTLHRIETKLDTLTQAVLKQGAQEMAIGQDILDAVTAETTSVDSFIALVQGLIDNGTIPPAVGTAILTQINSTKAKVDAAILANTPPPPPTP